MPDDRVVELEKIIPEEEAILVRPGYPRAPGYPSPNPAGAGYGYGYGEPEQGLHVRELWRTVRKRKYLIAVIAAIVTTLTTIEAYRDKSIYQASATVEIGKDTGTVVKLGDLLLQTDDFNTLIGIKTSMLILKSRPVLEDVVDELHLDKNPKFLDVGSRKSVLEALGALTGRVTGRPQSDAPDPVLLEASPIPTMVNQERTSEESARLAPFVGVLDGRLAVDQIKDTRALKVSFSHTDPVIAAAVANGVARDFTERSFQTKTQRFQTTSDWLNQSTRGLEAKVQEAEQKLADYSKANQIFATDKGSLTTDKLTRLFDQANRAETDRILKESLYAEAKAGRVTQLPEAFADPRITQYQTKLADLTVQLAKLQLKFGDENPQVRDVKAQIAILEEQLRDSRTSLQDKLKAEYERSVRDESSLKAALERAKAEASQQNQASIQFSILTQNRDTAKQLYVDFLQRYNQSKIEVAQQHNNLRVIETAQVPSGPIGPQRMRTIMVGLFLSLAAGVGLAFFLEYLDNTIKTVEDVNRYAQLPALSVIPAIAGNAPKRALNKMRNGRALGSGNGGRDKVRAGPGELVALDNRSSAAEAYRVLRTSVLLSAAGSPPKRILVTSGQPGEGKTTTVVNTAISLAQLGASVLVIDCDLRKPTAHKLFGIDHSRGLSTYLSRDVSIDGLIQKLQIPNLSLMPCGPIPPNPAELISSPKMREMLKTLSEQYDHILIDSPPLMNVTDPVILSTMVEGVILVVHGGRSTRAVVTRARQELLSVGAKIFGVVLNNVDLRSEGYDSYYYYRYYSDYGSQEGEGKEV